MAEHEFLYRGAFTMLKVNLNASEMLKAESGAMVAMSDTVDVEGKMEGGVLGGLGRMLTGEKFFFQKLVDKEQQLLPNQFLLINQVQPN